MKTDDYIYVDKTKYIVNLINEGKYYFLSRPRRFGKSLFLSTLKAFFEGKRELFKGLYIDSCDDIAWDSHPVIYIDLNGKSYTDGKSALIGKIHSQLIEYEKKYEIGTYSEDIAIRFSNIIREAASKTGKRTVILIDEYEKPILDTIHLDTVPTELRDALSAFYSVLKSMDEHIEFCFLTGVTKFGHLNIFSGLNNLHDISLSREYEGICGITREELLNNFSEGIIDLAYTNDISFEEALQRLKEHYDGYHFSPNMVDIYNPFSVLNALKEQYLSPYWYATGTPTFLMKQIINKKIKLYKFDELSVDIGVLLGYGRGMEDTTTVLYQAGYLTIKKYNAKRDRFILGFPNKEVSKAFLENLLPLYIDADETKTSNMLDDMADELIDGNPEKFLKHFNELFASFPYETALDTERHFHNIFYAVVKLLGYMVDSEYHTSDGSMDLLVRTDEFKYIFEFKIDQNPQVAIRQIEEKNYALQFESDPTKLFRIGVEFSTKKRCIADWKIEY